MLQRARNQSQRDTLLVRIALTFSDFIRFVLLHFYGVKLDRLLRHIIESNKNIFAESIDKAKMYAIVYIEEKGSDDMTNTNATNLRKNLFEYLSQAVNFNDVINVSTKDGNAVILSAEDYNGIMETVYLMSDSHVLNDIVEGKKEPLEQGTVYDPSEEW